MQKAGQSEWRRPGTVMAIIALVISGSVGGVVIWQALHSQSLIGSPPVTKTLELSKGRINLVGDGSIAYVNFTVPGNLITAFLNVTFTVVQPTNATRLSLVNQAQFQRFSSCNCVYYGNYSTVPTSWSSPMSNQYSAQIQIPYSGVWILVFQHEPGTKNTESVDETVSLTYTLQS